MCFQKQYFEVENDGLACLTRALLFPKGLGQSYHASKLNNEGEQRKMILVRAFSIKGGDLRGDEPISPLVRHVVKERHPF